jgi:hypothetical protein
MTALGTNDRSTPPRVGRHDALTAARPVHGGGRVAELDEWNAAQERARAEYRQRPNLCIWTGVSE